MAEPTADQRARIRQATERMAAMGVHETGYPDARRNGDVFITFRIEDLFPLIGLAETGARVDPSDRFLIDVNQAELQVVPKGIRPRIDNLLAAYIVVANEDNATAEAEAAAFDALHAMCRAFGVAMPTHAAALAAMEKVASN